MGWEHIGKPLSFIAALTNLETIPNHTLHVSQQHDSVVKELDCLTGLPAVQTCRPLKSSQMLFGGGYAAYW